MKIINGFTPQIYNTVQIRFKSRHNQALPHINEGKIQNKININLSPSQPYELSRQLARNKVIFETFLAKKGRVTKEEYEYIKNNFPFLIYECKKGAERNNLFSKPTGVAHIGISIKKYLDETEKNPNGYRIISIGTSPAILSRALEILGCEVVYLPASGINQYRTFREFEEEKNAKILLKYLKLKNVGKDDKTNILIDLTVSGKTLEFISKMVKKLSVNTKSFPLNEYDISQIFYHNSNMNQSWQVTQEEENDFFDDMWEQRIEEISNVPHFCIWKQKEKNLPNFVQPKGKSSKKIFKEFEEFSKPQARMFELLLFDEINKLIK